MSAQREPNTLQVAAESQATGHALVAEGERLLRLGKELLRQSALLTGQKPQEHVTRPDGPADDHSVGHAGLVDLNRAQAKARELKRFTRNQFGDALGLKGVQTSKWLAQLLERAWIERTVDEESSATVYDYIRRPEDEDPLYQVRQWAQNVGVAFRMEQCVEETELPSEEVGVAITQLVTEGVLRTETIEQVDGLDEVDQLGETVYRYAPPLPPGVAGDLERRRLQVVRDVPEVERGTPIRIRTERKTARARSTPGSRGKIKRNQAAWERQQAAKDERRRKNQAMAQKSGKRSENKPKS